MPCNDLTEKIKISLDNNNRVVNYSLTKRSCQFAVWDESLIIEWVKNRSLDEILNTSVKSFLEVNLVTSDIKKFMSIKHFESIQHVLEIVSGKSEGTTAEICVIESINYEPDGMEVTAFINLRLNTKNIISCSDKHS